NPCRIFPFDQERWVMQIHYELSARDVAALNEHAHATSSFLRMTVAASRLLGTVVAFLLVWDASARLRWGPTGFLLALVLPLSVLLFFGAGYRRVIRFYVGRIVREGRNRALVG